MNNTLLKSPRSLFKIEIPIIKKENDPFHFNLELEPIQKNTMFPSERALLTKEGNRQSLLELPMETFQQPTDNGHRSSMLQIFTLPLVKKAVQQLKAGLIYSNASPLDEKNAQFINDQAHNPKPEEKFPKIKNPVIRRVFLDASMVINKVNSLPVFGPYDNFRLLWDCLNFLAIFFLIFWIPVEIGFTTHLPTIYYSFFLIIFIIDIFLNMNTAYHMNGYLINDRILIYSNYVKNYLVFDLLSCVLFWLKQNEDLENSVELKNTSLFFFQWIFFLRIQNFKVIYGRFLERIYSKFNIRDSYIDLVNLIFTSMFILHIFACCWHFLAQYNGFVNYENTWMTKLDIDKKTIAVRYMYSLYWSSVTIMTVGYGDISPQNNSEVLFAIIAVCVGCAVTAYIISSLSTIANEFNKEGQIYK